MAKEARISSIVSLYPLPQYVVVLEDVEKKHLVPIWIGVHEGNAIALELQGEKFPRPLTHDLFVNVFSRIGVTIEKIVVSDLKENSYYAILHLRQGEISYEIDARPSDSLALAVRVKCPIFIEEKVLAKCPKMSETISEEDVEKFKDQLRSMTPEEFFRGLEETPGLEEPGIGDGAAEDPDDEEEDDAQEGGAGRS
ncbi:MAG: hypothetical protein MOGMAGMI_00982 [Candidatus Omnitrophica bacterium]|nr:hypothetical protein [Candidatus Omnitrophota bacterium]